MADVISNMRKDRFEEGYQTIAGVDSKSKNLELDMDEESGT